MEKPGTHYTEVYLRPKAGPDGYGKFRFPYRFSIPGLPSP